MINQLEAIEQALSIVRAVTTSITVDPEGFHRLLEGYPKEAVSELVKATISLGYARWLLEKDYKEVLDG